MTFDEMIVLVLLTVACVAGGLLLARLWRQHRDQKLIRDRLTSILHDAPAIEVTDLLESHAPEWIDDHRHRIPFLDQSSRMIERSGLDTTSSQVIALSLVLMIAIPLLAFVIEPAWTTFGLVAGALLGAAPWLVVYALSEQRRNKFVDQLPDGIELMISVLRSGLSIPQAVKSVAEELPAPCGPEFSDVLHRMNLGQSLPDSLQIAVDRYEVFELDLIRRAAAIQLEVGGSLADLLDKTNSTLRQRLKLKRKIAVHTAQSRLSGYIIAALPFFVALAFQTINPTYLVPLYTTNVGRTFVVLALLFQIAGILIIRRLANFRV
jgi:tight adherence protein B